MRGSARLDGGEDPQATAIAGAEDANPRRNAIVTKRPRPKGGGKKRRKRQDTSCHYGHSQGRSKVTSRDRRAAIIPQRE